MTARRDRDKWRITVVCDDDRAPPVQVRVRRFLKNALRAFGLRCIWYDSGPIDTVNGPLKPQTAQDEASEEVR